MMFSRRKFIPEHPDVTNWLARATATGDTVLSSQVAALDGLVKSLQSKGLWSTCNHFNPMLGADGSLYACRTPVKTGTSGAAQYTNTNFVTGDYTAAGGLISTGSTKRLATGYTPSNDSRDFNNTFFALEHVDDSYGNGTGSVDLSELTGTTRIANYYQIGGNGRGTTKSPWGRGLGWYTVDSGLAQVVTGHDWSATWRENANAGAMNSELGLYCACSAGSILNGKGAFGGLWVGSQLTRAQILDFVDAWEIYRRAIGRAPATSRCAFIGDSITQGTGATVATMPTTRWSRVYAAATGFRECNFGIANGCLQTDFLISGGTNQQAFGRNGNTAEVLRCKPSRVCIVLGTNDCRNYDTNSAGDTTKIATCQQNAITLINALNTGGISYSNIILGSIPWMDPTGSGNPTQAKQDLYVAAAAAAAASTGCKYKDLNAYMKNQTAWLIADGIHPNDAGMSQISTAMQAAA